IDSDLFLNYYFIFFREISQRTFVLIQKAMNWTDAREYCRNHHTDLAMMLTEPEARDLWTVKGPHRVWIGMYREPWRWSDNRNSSFKNWRDGQPNNYLAVQYCVFLNLDYTWGDDDCTKMRSFWCQTGDKINYFHRHISNAEYSEFRVWRRNSG
uniref:C-type lectin domain-containing protein n=1 Tax=Labrus bergylta TaxID=56723 RepID=A0A3Q3FVM3_9LABR